MLEGKPTSDIFGNLSFYAGSNRGINKPVEMINANKRPQLEAELELYKQALKIAQDNLANLEAQLDELDAGQCNGEDLMSVSSSVERF